MIVTFISQCEKKALNKTRRVLDAFANRIGDKTWQTVITIEGLNAVKKLLRKSASKNTAVSCHRIHSNRTELIWIVGNRKKFNDEGYIPVNTSKANVVNIQWENDWHYMPLINSLTALSALFHDWGKSTLCFQEKLSPKKSQKFMGDPLRHEWISCLMLQAFVNQESDEIWLFRLAHGTIDEKMLRQTVNIHTHHKNPLSNLPNAASLIAWLIISHHRLPLPKNKDDCEHFKGLVMPDFKTLLALIKSNFGYENIFEEDYQQKLKQCFEFPNGLLSQSNPWVKQLKKWASRLLRQLKLLEKVIENGCWRLILHHCRLSLMLGDHFYSSQDADVKWQSSIKLYANTDRETKQFKQKLDEHLVGVAKNALQINYLLPQFEKELPFAQNIKALRKRSPKEYLWQDKAVKVIKEWRKTLPESANINQTGFFVVNMASTGCGKTFANAKIMKALSKDFNSLRYVLALGLRTLTLQTGDEYRERIKLDETELAVLIGSKAVSELHQKNRETLLEQEQLDYEVIGSESLEQLLDGNIHFECAIPENRLTTVLNEEKDRKFLYAPVLTCTIDHIMSATETKRGGRYILPTLRLISSDLVIDEVDDFDGKDLIAIGRLIHLAGMLGRKVMISSATIPPDLAEGFFNAYREGWHLYSLSRNVSYKVGCAWVDEFNTKVETIDQLEMTRANQSYNTHHQHFITKRTKKLLNEPCRRKGKIIECHDIRKQNEDLELNYFKRIQQTIIENHHLHHTIDNRTLKKISFGVIRTANISPCIALAEYLMNSEWSSNIDAKVMAYHSQQVLLLRSEQEKHLDEVLKRKETENEQPKAFGNKIIRCHLDLSQAENIIFILIATPVEEVGRDHDFDWAIIEPSSFRSIIQLAGRVMRHRKFSINDPNISLLQYNLKAMKGSSIAYHRPGYERSTVVNENFKLKTHNLTNLLIDSKIEESITSIPRITKNITLEPQQRLADLEHYSMEFLLTNYQACGPEGLQGWLTQCWWLTAIPQKLNPFRESTNSICLYRVWKDGQAIFMELNDEGEYNDAQMCYGIVDVSPDYNKERVWLERDYKNILENIQSTENESLQYLSKRYGEINIPLYGNDFPKYSYCDQFGLKREG